MSLVVWGVGIFLMFILFLTMVFFTVILFPFDKKRKVAHAQCFWWADAVIRLNPYWDVTVSGLENIDHSKTYVIVANHQSLADIILFYKTRMQFKWVAKESLFRVPLLGWNLSLAKHIRIDRGNFSSIKTVYRQAAGWLRRGMSVIFFPEGTRSETGEMKDFQNGAFKLALREKVPILPVRINGTGNAIPKGNWRFTAKVPCSITVLPAVATSGFEERDFETIKERVRSALEAAAS